MRVLLGGSPGQFRAHAVCCRGAAADRGSDPRLRGGTASHGPLPGVSKLCEGHQAAGSLFVLAPLCVLPARGKRYETVSKARQVSVMIRECGVFGIGADADALFMLSVISHIVGN